MNQNKKYEIVMLVKEYHTLEIYADSQEEAEELAYEHGCDGESEDTVLEIVSVEGGE